MKICVYFLVGCLAQATANAADSGHSLAMASGKSASIDQFFGPISLTEAVLKSIQDDRADADARQIRDQPEHPAARRVREPPFAASIASAWKKGFIELGVEAEADVLAQCQQEQSLTLTMPFMRSEGQQAHCFRF